MLAEEFLPKVLASAVSEQQIIIPGSPNRGVRQIQIAEADPPHPGFIMLRFFYGEHGPICINLAEADLEMLTNLSIAYLDGAEAVHGAETSS